MKTTPNLARGSLLRTGCALLPALLALGCVGTQATNVAIDRSAGYHPIALQHHRNIGDVGLMVSFSGGGTRAAALAFGVMQELRDTAIRTGGKSERLLDQIDVITSVSGGSFTAAYYGLYGDRLFDDFEPRFLRRNVEGGILWRLLMPHNWLRMLSPSCNRTSGVPRTCPGPSGRSKVSKNG